METSNANQYLTFTLDDEQYAIGVAKVREVLEHTKITKLPRTAEFMKGIINLRGAGVPVIDLRLKFGMPETPITKDTSIIVMEVESQDGKVVVGALADSVHEVVEIDEKAIENAPRFGTRLAAEFIRGVGKKDEAFIIILDIDRIFNAEEMTVLTREAAPAEATA
ncbi:MAG TPA: chemotaxis protein CheW [Spirochaetales bacterium]|nr:chemotaxis protein CheW [Spirochaetales bacterium]HRY55381.1 chemotaxis protein CheW [Spirochaetia bacterium]HRZ64540.1 chemotaxis protein CheW [Spirochaetia bacterium]